MSIIAVIFASVILHFPINTNKKVQSQLVNKTVKQFINTILLVFRVTSYVLKQKKKIEFAIYVLVC